MTDEFEEHYSLVMPFVACKSEGGPFDDASFVAGYRLGQLDAKLSTGWAASICLPIEPSDRPQCDLLAMRYGYDLVTEPWEEFPDDWLNATFTRA